MSTQTDKQYVAIAGKPDGETWLVDYRKPEGQTHTLIRFKDDWKPLHLKLGTIDCPPTFQDALKISGARFVDVECDYISGGTEDCVDINHSDSVTLYNKSFVPKGRYVATIKGGSTNILVMFSDVIGKPKYVDFDIGNWSDQSANRTSGVTITSQQPQSRQYTVRQLHARKPTLHGDFKVSSWASPYFYTVYSTLKKLGLA